MSIEQLNARRLVLPEQASLQEGVEAEAGNSSSSGTLRSRLAEVTAELSAIQKALLAIAGLGAVSALTDDGYNDNVPPVITINGDNPATVELGSTYVDDGATAFDDFHGVTEVTSSDQLIQAQLDHTQLLILLPIKTVIQHPQQEPSTWLIQLLR